MQGKIDNKKTADLSLERAVKEVVDNYFEQIHRNKSIPELSLVKATQLIDLVVKKATAMELNVVVAIYSKAARPIAVHCMDDSYIASYDIAINKAYTSVALKMSTMYLKQLSTPAGPLYGIQHTNEGKIIIFGGGEPLLYGEKVIGGIGVSGGTEEQDTMLAEYGKSMFEEVMQWQ